MNALEPRAPVGMMLLLLGLSGCGLLDPEICTAYPAPWIIVEVRDAATGAPAASGVVGHAEDGIFRFDLMEVEAGGAELLLYGLSQEVGTYRVTLTKEGYAPWQQEGVRLRRDDCDVRTVRLRADLQPL